jgi:hypothetical protein
MFINFAALANFVQSMRTVSGKRAADFWAHLTADLPVSKTRAGMPRFIDTRADRKQPL